MEKRIEENIPVLGRVSLNFRDLATRIFKIYQKENEVERQKSTAHLGLISKAFHGINHSRYDYLIIQCVISELADNIFRGTTSTQGSIKIKGKKYDGNDIIKSWILLSNFGHCKNTIGDEKALLLKAIQRQGLKSKLINSIKDKELKVWASKTIEEFDYVNFHHVLSIGRIYKCLPRRVEFQNEIIRVYKLLLLEPHLTNQIAKDFQVVQLQTIFKNIRNLSIIALDSRNSSLPISVDILSTVLSFDFYESRYEQTKVNDILNPILSLLYDTLYLNKKSQTFQRSYEIESANQMPENYTEALDKAILHGLSNPDNCVLEHFLRVELHTNYTEKLSLKDALRNTLTVKREMPNVEASLDYNPFTSKRIMDFYIMQKINSKPRNFLNS